MNSQTIDNLQERLSKEKNRLTAEENHASALAVTSKGNRKSSDSNASKERGNKKKNFECFCFYCHKKGHYEQNCRKKKQDGESGWNKNSMQEDASTSACFLTKTDH